MCEQVNKEKNQTVFAQVSFQLVNLTLAIKHNTLSLDLWLPGHVSHSFIRVTNEKQASSSQ